MTPPWAVLSPIRAAGRPPTSTVAEPFTMASGGPAQVAESPMTAAGCPPISTVATPGPVTGPPTCGLGPAGVGSCMGQVCMSPTRAAGSMAVSLTKRQAFRNSATAVLQMQSPLLWNASVTWGENSKMARRSLSLQGFSGPSVSDGGRDSVEPPHVTEGLPCSGPRG